MHGRCSAERNGTVRHDMIHPRNSATLHRDSTASKFTAGTSSGRTLQQTSVRGSDHGQVAVGPSIAMQPSSHAARGPQLLAIPPAVSEAARHTTAPASSVLLEQAAAAMPEDAYSDVGVSPSIDHQDMLEPWIGEPGPAMPGSSSSPSEVPDISPHSWPSAGIPMHALSPDAYIGSPQTSDPLQQHSTESPDTHHPQPGMVADALPWSSSGPSDVAVGTAGNMTGASVPIVAPPPAPALPQTPAPKPPRSGGTLLDSFADDPVSQGRLGLSMVVILSTMLCCCSSAACLLFLLVRSP